MLNVRDDLEPLPLFNAKGQQVGIGIGLYIWDEAGALCCQWEDQSRPCRDHEELPFLGDDDDDRMFGWCPEDFQRSTMRDDE